MLNCTDDASCYHKDVLYVKLEGLNSHVPYHTWFSFYGFESLKILLNLLMCGQLLIFSCNLIR